MLWDIFCRVVDNFGDIGVTWRLSADLARRGETVRLWVDDASALHWMAPGALEGHWQGIAVLPWARAHVPLAEAELPPADVWIEAFGCDIPTDFITSLLAGCAHQSATKAQQPVWINLEYLSAEPYVERSHLLLSPVMSGPARGWNKTFFYPGFTSGTGGLLGQHANAGFRCASKPEDVSTWLKERKVTWQGERLVSLFCYEPSRMAALLEPLAQDATPTLLLVTAGRASAAVRALLGDAAQTGNLQLQYLPYLTQLEFDRLLRICDLNCVRGEDSIVRAIWAGKPFVWHIYPQEDGAHWAKLEAFLNLLRAPESMRTFHRLWNGTGNATTFHTGNAAFPVNDLSAWEGAVTRLRDKLLQMDDLATQLVQFARKNR